MTAPTAERIAAIRTGVRAQGYLVYRDKRATVDLLAALDEIANILRLVERTPCSALSHVDVARDLIDYIGWSPP